MRRLVVFLTLSLGFTAPLAVSVAEAADAQSVRASTCSTDCRRQRAKKPQGEPKKKDKDKDKDGKKPYGFEL
jgi:hypothetical protein